MEQPIITAFDDYGALECCDAICPTRDPYFTIVVFDEQLRKTKLISDYNGSKLSRSIYSIYKNVKPNWIDFGFIYKPIALKYLFSTLY